ncbi:uncharacterized protein LOC110990969, partial [Acanthaster planci]|uniref:Uncharacterized protein LOC110990969 n=1 Tax=Acanthaster planci TaxID=133434 RepID=A0A8B8A6U6_ACAPL
MDDLVKGNREIIYDFFISSCPLGCIWPKNDARLIVKVGDECKIYRKTGNEHAEAKFLEELEEAMNDDQKEFTLYGNYSPCDSCSSKILEFLGKHIDVTFNIRFAHLYIRLAYEQAIHIELNNLDQHEHINLRAMRGQDWIEIVRLISIKENFNAWETEWQNVQQHLQEWATTKQRIIGSQTDWNNELGMFVTAKWNKRIPQLQAVDNELPLHDDENWVNNQVGHKDHNDAMQLLHNCGENSLNTVLENIDHDNETGYAFLLHVLQILGHDEAGHDEAGHDEAGHDEAGHDEAGHDEAGHDEAGHDEVGQTKLLRKRIVADYTAQKELEYILQGQNQGANQAQA